MTIKYSYWPQNLPNGRQVVRLSIKYTNTLLQDPQKITQIVIFGLKIYYLAAPV
jgi:hypothetical protein